jgi:hypothetical protein
MLLSGNGGMVFEPIVSAGNPERKARKTIRLLNRVTRIEWDECRDEAHAEHREEMLICVLLPKFNRAGKVWPRKS